jgi:peptidoglycan hydrolase-like protein with peptidoglycan-binding domain
MLLAAVAAWWAATATLERPKVPTASPEPVLYEVQDGTLSSAQSFTAQAEWEVQPVASNAADGIVTGLALRPGERVRSGDELYEVNLRPVIAAEGSKPAFRDLKVGAVGADVLQLERFLDRAVEFNGTIDTEFTDVTADAVRQWQERTGVEADGVVRRGDIVFIDSLPARALLSPELRVGAQVGYGTGNVSLLAAAPQYEIPLGADQQDLVPLIAPVEVEHRNGTWDAEIAEVVDNEVGELLLVLEAPDGGPVCATRCEIVPVGKTSYYEADVIVVPETSGPEVPAAALRTKPGGAVFVRDARGKQVRVEVLAAADGRAIVDGLAVGDMVRLFNQPTSDSP